MSIEARIPDIYKNIPAEVSPATPDVLRDLEAIKIDIQKADSRNPYEPIKIGYQDETPPTPESQFSNRAAVFPIVTDAAGIAGVNFEGKFLTIDSFLKKLEASTNQDCTAKKTGDQKFVAIACNKEIPVISEEIKKAKETSNNSTGKIKNTIQKAIASNNWANMETPELTPIADVCAGSVLLIVAGYYALRLKRELEGESTQNLPGTQSTEKNKENNTSPTENTESFKEKLEKKYSKMSYAQLVRIASEGDHYALDYLYKKEKEGHLWYSDNSEF